jgi:hypothetical protein
MFFDPIYWVVIGLSALISMGAQAWVKSRVERWSDVALKSGMTGAQVARAILQARGISGVRVEQTDGYLTDHYDPSDKVLRLGPNVFHESTVTAAGIAAHEVGHALQDQEGYAPMRLRQKSVPVASLGTNLGIWLIIGGLVIGFTGLAKVGVALFAGFVAFTLITLPVEFDASSRAKQVLADHGLVRSDELEGVSQVLTAAAATYVAAAVTAILQLLYWLSVLNRRN